jgi:hypothetical protein
MPHTFRDVFARYRIGEHPLSRKLIAFLPVFAATLPIALASDHGAATTLTSHMPRCEDHIDNGQTVLHAFRLMLDSARVHRDGAFGFGKPVRGLLNVFRRHTGHFRYFAGIPCCDGFFHRIEASGVLRNKLLVLKAVPQNDVEHAFQKS